MCRELDKFADGGVWGKHELYFQYWVNNYDAARLKHETVNSGGDVVVSPPDIVDYLLLSDLSR